MFDTSARNEATTEPETGRRQEVRVLAAGGYEINTGARYFAGSVPSGLPPTLSEGGAFVFRVASGMPLEQVTVTLDIKQLTEQARVRKVNQAIRRAGQR